MDQAGNNRPVAVDAMATAPETTHMRAQIAQTRARMTGTLGALQDRLRPDHLKQQAGDAVREAVETRVARVRSSAAHAGRRVAAQTRTSVRELQSQAHAHPAVAGGIVAALVGLAAALIARRRRGARVMPPLVPAVLIGAAGYYALSQAATRRPQAAARVSRAAGAAGRRAAHEARDWADRHPMVLGATALVAGVVAGAALPVLTVPSPWLARAPR